MATSIIKADEIRKVNDTVLMSDGALSDNVQFPAGHVIQTVNKAATVTATESSGSNVVQSSDFFNKSITAKGNNSIFVIHAFIGKTYVQNSSSYGKVALTRNLNSTLTYLNQLNGGGIWGGIAVQDYSNYNPQSFCWVDTTSCSVGDTIDYVINFVRWQTGGNSYYFIHGANNGSYCSYVIQEIAA